MTNAETPTGHPGFVTGLAWTFIGLSGFATLVAVLQNVMISVMLPPETLHAPARGTEDLPAFAQFMFSHPRMIFAGFLAVSVITLVSAIGLPIPTPVEKWLDLLGAAAAPCALFAIGLFLSDKSIRSGLAEAGCATLIKLLVQPLAAWLLLPFFVDIASVPGKVALLMAALPTAANAFVLAKQFDVSVEQNTASVLLSTAFSVVTVSALLVWLRVT